LNIELTFEIANETITAKYDPHRKIATLNAKILENFIEK